MGSVNWGNVGQAAAGALCSVVYGTVNTVQKAANGDGWGAFESGMETICPIGIGQSANAVERYSRGDTAGGVQKTVETLLPGSFLDPVTTAGSVLTGELAKDATQSIIDSNTAAEAAVSDVTSNSEEDPVAEEQQKTEEKEDARDITNQQANTARKAAYQAAINSGATPAQAQAAADAQTPIGNTAGNYSALSQAGANARAAYRERQGYADALGRESQNLEEARKRAIAAAALSGASSGASTGISLFGNSSSSGE
jgi:hypothetical protein